jgi:signal transduction histidine kinase
LSIGAAPELQGNFWLAALDSAERGREREREQLLDAQKALEESRRIEALARMAGGIAHDFNNALTVIMGAAESVRLANSLPEAASCAGEIVAGARQAAELTRKLLTLGRQQVASPRPVLLAPLFERLRASFRRVLLCSGYLREELLRRGVATGRYAFLPKPFSAQDLVSAVRGLARSSG